MRRIFFIPLPQKDRLIDQKKKGGQQKTPHSMIHMISPQTLADALTLLCVSVCTDTWYHGALAVTGGLTALPSVYFLPTFLSGTASKFASLCIVAWISALGVRCMSLSDKERKLDRTEPLLYATAAAFVFVPEALIRTAALMRRSTTAPFVEVWHSGEASLCIGGVPSLPLVRRLCKEHSATPPTAATIVNLCSWWRGFYELYESLALTQVRRPAGQADVLELVRTLERSLLLPPSPPTPGPRVVYLHCETGAFAAAVASAFVATVSAMDAAAATECVSQSVAGRLPCSGTECYRLAKLVLDLQRGGSKPTRSGKGIKKGHGSGNTNRGAPPPPAAAGAATPRPLEHPSDDDDDDDDEKEAAAAEAERVERWATYQRAVATHGLPGSSDPAAAAAGGPWTQVSAAVRRPATGSSASGVPSYAGAFASVYPSAPTPRAAETESGLTEKQRKNRRKAEKAKEESARREAERQARLQATIRSRAAGC
jgi:hypothetical protein